MREPKILVPVIVIVSLALCGWVSNIFVRNLREEPSVVASCTDRNGSHHSSASDRVGFLACRQAEADVFLKADYAEMKDLAKAFLTLLTAALIASITFSEKIVDLSNAGLWARVLMIISWIAIFIAIMSLGAGLSFMTVGAGCATYSPTLDYRMFETKAIMPYIFAGVSFGFGLATMLVSGCCVDAASGRSYKAGNTPF
jgi:hypothetical protein